MKQTDHKGSDKWFYLLIALVIVVFYGLLGKADVNAATYEQNANYCASHTVSNDTYMACVQRLNK